MRRPAVAAAVLLVAALAASGCSSLMDDPGSSSRRSRDAGGDGSTFSPQLRSDFAEGAESRAIDLPGEGRRIQRIDIDCRSTSKSAGRATITMLAR